MPNGNATILVVDADAARRAFLRRVLRPEGYRVFDAADYQGACNVYQQHRGQIHLLLTAISLPGGNGYVLARKLTDIEPGLKVMLISGKTGAVISQYYETLDTVQQTLHWPFEPDELVRRIRNTLGFAAASGA